MPADVKMIYFATSNPKKVENASGSGLRRNNPFVRIHSSVILLQAR